MRGDRPRARHSRRRRTPRRRRRLVPRPRRRGQARASAHARRPRRPRRPAGHPARPRRRSGRWRRRTLREVVAEARTRTRNRNRTPIVAFDRHRNRNRPSHTLHRRSFAGRSPSPRRPRRRRARAFRAVLAETFSSDVAATRRGGGRQRILRRARMEPTTREHVRGRSVCGRSSFDRRESSRRSRRFVFHGDSNGNGGALGAVVVRSRRFAFRRRGDGRRRRKGMGSRRRRDGRVVHPRAARGNRVRFERARRVSLRAAVPTRTRVGDFRIAFDDFDCGDDATRGGGGGPRRRGKFLDARRERRRDILRVARRSRGDGEGSRRVL